MPTRGGAAALLVVLAAIGAASAADPVRAAPCRAPEIAGDWKRAAPGEMQDLVRLEIIHRCSPGQSGERAVLPGRKWTVRAFARCRPHDCKWGRVPAETGDHDDELYALFPTFAAVRALRMTREGDLLEVEIFIEYRNEERGKDISTATFVRDD